jgi:Co/Zn/Cd efflux system component
MLGDAAVSFGVVLAAVLTLWTGWIWLDPAISLAIAIFVLWVGWGLARSSVNLAPRCGGTTLQIEHSPDACRLAPDNVV